MSRICTKLRVRLFLKMLFHFLSVALTSLKLSLMRADAFIGNGCENKNKGLKS